MNRNDIKYDSKTKRYYIISNNIKFYLDRILDRDLFIKYNI